MERVHLTSALSELSCPTTLVLVTFVEAEVGGRERHGGKEAACRGGESRVGLPRAPHCSSLLTKFRVN